MAYVVGVSDVAWHHHLTGPDRKIQTPQNPCENLKCVQKQIFSHYFDVFFLCSRVTQATRQKAGIKTVPEMNRRRLQVTSVVCDQEQGSQRNSIACLSDQQ